MNTKFKHWNERNNQANINVDYYNTKEEAIKGALDYWRHLTPIERKKTFYDYISEVDANNDDEWISDVMYIVSDGILNIGFDYSSYDGLVKE